MGRFDTPAAIFVARLVSSALGVITGPIIARMLGADGRGESAAAVSALYLVPILLGLGLPLEVRAAVARSGEAARYTRSYRFLCVLLFPPAIVLALLLTRFAFADLSIESNLALAIGLCLAPLMVSWMCDESVLIAGQKYQQVAILQLTLPLSNCLFIVAGAVGGWVSVPWVIYSYTGGTIMTAIVGWLFVGVSRGSRIPSRLLIRPSIKFAGSSIAEAASNRLDQVLVLSIIGATQSGLYSAAATFGALAMGAAHALGSSLFRNVAVAGDTKSAARSGIAQSIALGVVCMVALLVGSPLAIYLLFGEGFMNAIPASLILAVGAVFLVLNYISSVVLVALGRGPALTISQVAGVVVGVVFLFAIGPQLGAIGAAIAAVAGYASTSIIALRAATGHYWVRFPSRSDFRAAILALVVRSSVRANER